MKVVGFILLFSILGFAVGYSIYGKVNDEYVNPVVFFTKPEGILQRAYSGIKGFENKRQNLIIATAVGAILGLLIGAVSQNTKKGGGE